MKFLSKNHSNSTRLHDKISKKPKLSSASIVDEVGPARVPNFLCIGSEKAGTTWLWHWMNKHPDIGVPASKELRFFSSGSSWDSAHFKALTRFLENPEAMPTSPHFKQALAEQIRLYYGGEQAYLKIFGRMEHTIVGEVSPQYCALAPSRIATIRATIPSAKIIYMLRDPVERLLSGARMVLKQDKLELNDSNIIRYAANPMQRHLSDGDKHLSNYERVFGKENVKTVFFDDVTTKPSETFNDVCEFLGVKPMNFDRSDISKKINKGTAHEIPVEAKAALRKSLSSIYDRLDKRFPELVRKWCEESV